MEKGDGEGQERFFFFWGGGSGSVFFKLAEQSLELSKLEEQVDKLVKKKWKREEMYRLTAERNVSEKAIPSKVYPKYQPPCLSPSFSADHSIIETLRSVTFGHTMLTSCNTPHQLHLPATTYCSNSSYKQLLPPQHDYNTDLLSLSPS